MDPAYCNGCLCNVYYNPSDSNREGGGELKGPYQDPSTLSLWLDILGLLKAILLGGDSISKSSLLEERTNIERNMWCGLKSENILAPIVSVDTRSYTLYKQHTDIIIIYLIISNNLCPTWKALIITYSSGMCPLHWGFWVGGGSVFASSFLSSSQGKRIGDTTWSFS